MRTFNIVFSFKSQSLYLYIRAFLVLACSVLPAFSSAAVTKTETIDNLLLQWQQIESQRSQLQQQWQLRENVLEQQILLMDQERDALKRLLGEKGTAQNDVEAERQALLVQQSQLEKQQAVLKSAVQQAKSQIMTMYAQLPPVLQESWQIHIDHLTTENASSEALTHIAEALKKLYAFNQRVVVHQTVMTLIDNNKEKKTQVKQIFMGTSKAWYLSTDGAHWGEGKPSAEGWVWQAKEQQAPTMSTSLSALITSLEQPSKAQWISLPLTLSSLHKPSQESTQ